MSVRTDTVNLIINVNSNAAQNQLNELRKRAADLGFAMKTNKKGTEEYIAAAKELKNVNADMDKLKKQIGITALSQKELVSELNKMKAMKGSMVPFTKEFKNMDAQIKMVESRLYDVRNGVTGLSPVFSRVNKEVKQFGIMAASYLGFSFITSQFSSIIKGSGKIADQLSDLRRVAGLTADETDRLNASLKNIDTRTANSSLRDIAIIAGKLGVAKNDIFDFTKAVDQLVVSLGDELGDADQITTQLGKILNVFEGKITGDNITKLGNAFVELANSGAATGAFIADFDQRLSGIAKSAGISLGALSGLGAGLEEMGARVESSSTAIQKLIVNINSDVPKAAAIAGKSLEEFKNILKIDPTEALLQYSEGLVKNKNSFDEVVSSMKDAGEEGARVIEVISKLGSSSDQLRERIDLGKKSIQQNNAILDAFALKNENLGAEIDKLGKQFDRFTSSSGMISFVSGLIKGFSALLSLLAAIPGPLIKLTLSFGALIAAIALYNSGMIAAARASLINAAATLKNIVVINAQAAAIVLSRIATQTAISVQAAYIVVTNLLTGSISAATAATRLFSIVTKTGLGPIGLLIVAIGLIVKGVLALSKAFKASADASSFHARTLREAAKELSEQQSQISTLTAVIKDNTLSQQGRAKALKDLIALSPEYLHGLTQENIATEEGKRILDDYNTSLEKNANLKAASLLKDKEFEKNVKLRSIQQELEIAQKAGKGFGDLSEDAQNAFSSWSTSIGRIRNVAELLNIIPSTSDFKEALKNIQGQIDESTNDVNLATDNYLKMQGEKDQARRAFLLHQVTVNRQAMLQFKRGSEEFNQAQKDYLASIEKYNAEFGFHDSSSASATAKEDPSVAARRKTLEKLIEDSKAAYEKLNATDLAGQKANLALREKYQAELDKLDNKQENKSGSSRNSEYERLRKEAEAFLKSVEKLKEDAVNASKTQDERELISLEQKYDDMQAKALEFFRKNIISRSRYNDEIKTLTEAFNIELSNLQKKQFEKTSETEYNRAIQDTRDYFDKQRNQEGKFYADGKINKMQYDAAIVALDISEKQQLVTVATDYSETTKKAETDLATFKKDVDKETTDEAIKQSGLRIRNAKNEALSKATLAVIAAPEGSKARINAQKDLIREQFKQDTEYLDKKSEAYKLAEAQLNEALENIDKEARQRRIQAFDEFAQQLLSITDNFTQALGNLDQRELSADQAKNEAKKNNYKKQLDSKLMSQRQYDKKIAEADADLDKKKKEIDLRTFKRQQALAITGALINGAMAITSTLAARPGLADIFTLGAARAIQVGLVVAATAAQVASIATRKPPTAARGRWFRNGKKHKDGGIPVEIERDEAVINARTMNDNRQYTVTGTPAQITSKLNSANGGLSWASGGQMQPKFRERPASMNPGLPRIMEQGGIVRNINPDRQSGSGNNDELLKQLIAKQDELITEVKNQKDRLHAVVSIKEYREEEKKYDTARKTAGMSQ